MARTRSRKRTYNHPKDRKSAGKCGQHVMNEYVVSRQRNTSKRGIYSYHNFRGSKDELFEKKAVDFNIDPVDPPAEEPSVEPEAEEQESKSDPLVEVFESLTAVRDAVFDCGWFVHGRLDELEEKYPQLNGRRESDELGGSG